MKFAGVSLHAIDPQIADRLRDSVIALVRTNRVLIVVESSSWFTASFGIGRAIRAVDGADFGFAVSRVTLAVRDGGPPTRHAIAEADRLTTATYTGFRFDMTEPDGTRTVDHFDQVWCFGINPGNGSLQNDAGITAPGMNPLSAGEITVLRAWMDAGGGLFATGDHDVLGASIGSFLPRARRMRRWKAAEGAPPIGDPTGLGELPAGDYPGDTRDRIDTTRPHLASEVPGPLNPHPDVIEFSRQSDTTVQPIEWVADRAIGTFFAEYRAPHPLLCHPTLGPIDVMPDHPHEGKCFDDSEFTDPDGDFPAGSRPRVVAYGTTLPSPPYVFDKGEQPGRRFPMISAYDGQAHGVGRVVVDSTWHHWMDVNVDAIAAADTVEWQKIARYYVNVAIWLARPAWRAWMFESVLTALPYTYFGVQELSARFTTRYLGERLAGWLFPVLGPCWVRHFLLDVLVPREVFQVPPDAGPCLTCPPLDDVLAATLGEIVRERLAEGSPITRALHADGKVGRISDAELLRGYTRAAAKGLADLADRWERSLDRTRDTLARMRVAAKAGC